jgi:transposase
MLPSHALSRPRAPALPVLKKGLKHARTGWFWAHAVDDRPWGGPAAPAVVYIYAPTRKHG